MKESTPKQSIYIGNQVDGVSQSEGVTEEPGEVKPVAGPMDPYTKLML